MFKQQDFIDGINALPAIPRREAIAFLVQGFVDFQETAQSTAPVSAEERIMLMTENVEEALLEATAVILTES